MANNTNENNLSKTDKALLSYLTEAYDVEPESPLYNAAKKLLEKLWQGSICVSFAEIEGLTKEMLLESKAVGNGETVRPIVFDGENLYIQRYFVYQKKILEKIEELTALNKLHIITGGPGTGKTTSLAGELAAITKNDDIILLAAPTGKAAVRMNDALNKTLELEYDAKKEHTHWRKNCKEEIRVKLKKLEAKTIHRLLGTVHLSVNFRHTKENPLKADIVVIDECSMVDLPIMAKLLEAIPDNCRVFLLGDKNQLASIETGSVFADLCEKFDKNDSVLTKKTENYRAEEAPGIVKLSEQIIPPEKDMEKNIEINFNNENVKLYNSVDISINDFIEEIGKNYKGLFTLSQPKEAIGILNKFQVLCAIKNGSSGTVNVNKKLCEKAKEENAKFTPIIITENNYNLGLFNGDIGVKDEEYAYFLDNDTVKKYLLLTLSSYEYAFAITIHKSQGSEYDSIAVVYPDSEKDDDNTIFTRELLYTAVTRARKECLIYGSEKMLKDSCKKRIFRASGIK